MTTYTADMTEREIGEFLTETEGTGMLGFGGENPYVIPMGCIYRRGDVLMGLITKPYGRKMECLEKNPKVCYTFCRTRAQTNLKKPCTTVVIEGVLEKVTDRAYYGLGPARPEVYEKMGLVLNRLVAHKISGRRCTQKPCELIAARAKARATKKAEAAQKAKAAK